jgi:lysophospholipase L1-like esterase
MVLGESTPSEYTTGYKLEGVTRADLFPYVIEKSLSEKYKVKVYDLAVPGMTSSTISQNLEAQLIEYKPNLVISLMGANDRNKFLNGLNTRLIAGRILIPQFISDLRVYKLGVAIYDMIDGDVRVEHGTLVYRSNTGSDAESNAELATGNEEKLEGKQLVTNYEKIINLVRQYHSTIVPITYLHSYDDLNADFKTIEDAEKVNFVSLSVQNASTVHPDWFLASDHWHPSKIGHQIMAEGILNYFTENKTIEAACSGYKK